MAAAQHERRASQSYIRWELSDPRAFGGQASRAKTPKRKCLGKRVRTQRARTGSARFAQFCQTQSRDWRDPVTGETNWWPGGEPNGGAASSKSPSTSSVVELPGAQFSEERPDSRSGGDWLGRCGWLHWQLAVSSRTAQQQLFPSLAHASWAAARLCPSSITWQDRAALAPGAIATTATAARSSRLMVNRA
jgi:hypothetical protein